MSFRFKVPLALSLAILMTGMVVTAALAWRAFEDLRTDLYRNATEVGAVLANSLPTAIKHDDLWQAYQIIGAANNKQTLQRMLVVLDQQYRIYVSNHPKELPVRGYLRAQGAEFARLEYKIRETPTLEPYAYEVPQNRHLYVIMPMTVEGVAIGTLVIGYSRDLFTPRFYGIVMRVAWSSLAVMALLLPIGWYLGGRMVKPLLQLTDCMSRVGHQPPRDIQCTLTEGSDEIGQLGTGFRRMLNEMEEKQRMERDMVASERLAAIGKLAAGVAHEINNPLGGMLNAISTLRQHGSSDPVTVQTISLLERGLKQIQETVSALLVEAKADSHELTRQDVDDVFTLLQPRLQKRKVRLEWSNQLHGTMPLPSTPVRQVLLNLGLNAIDATPEGGRIRCQILMIQDRLLIDVVNEGEPIPREVMEKLFEPFVGSKGRGSGLGLWVTYQIVQQLNGHVDVESHEQGTSFIVNLPIREAS